MKNGTVLAYSKDVSTGIIRAADGKRVFFSDRNWKSATAPCQGQAVRFEEAPGGKLQVYFESDVRTQIRAV